jgi:hypothetical protein
MFDVEKTMTSVEKQSLMSKNDGTRRKATLNVQTTMANVEKGKVFLK